MATVDDQPAPPPADADGKEESPSDPSPASEVITPEASAPDITTAASAGAESVETVESVSNAAAVTETPTTEINATTTPTTEAASPTNAAIINTTAIFPCIEQPLRVTLHCNGYYLWGLRKGRVIARKRRSEKDEFRLEYQQDRGLVKIHNHKFNSTLTVLVDEETGTKKLVCVKKDKDKQENDNGMDDSSRRSATSEQQKEETPTAEGGGSAAPSTATAGDTGTESEVFTDEIEEEDKPVLTDTDKIMEEDQTWCFIRGSDNNQVLLKSLRTGENLAIDAKGQIVFCADDVDPEGATTMAWDVECSTGELCFIGNPALNMRLRCDMAGLATLTDSWKGWEVFRFMEASHGYVKISSWMHSQWLLCSRGDGRVTTCLMAESFLDDGDPDACSKWAIEKAPEGSAYNGVTIRSKTFGTLLCVEDGQLKMFREEANGENNVAAEATENEQGGSAAKGKWWSSSVASMNNSMRSSVSSVQKRLSRASIKSSTVSKKDTTVWQLEAAHSQTYYFAANPIEGEKPKSIGPFPHVTPNLRKTDKIKLMREADGTTKMYNTEKKQFIACSASGEIIFVEDGSNKWTDWIMDKPSYQQGGSIFRSKLHNLYLSYEDLGEAEAGDNHKGGGHFNFFGDDTEGTPKLVGAELMGQREVWRLEPCMPRAVSSEKIATFALGTGIAVGTTVAMPFALAGVGAVMGALGAEVGIVANVIFAGLTGAEALASVGAIGATAYLVFRPEDNSLTDDHKNEEEEEAERAWSKRPFSNWRNW